MLQLSGPVDLASQLINEYRDLLVNLLGTISGDKTLVLQRTLTDPLALIISFSTLQQHGVRKVFYLENDNVDSCPPYQSVLFLSNTYSPSTLRLINSQISRLQATTVSPTPNFYHICIPHQSKVVALTLENSGKLGDVSILDLPIYFIPLSDDLFSLELNTSFRDLYLYKDPTCLYYMSQALMDLQFRLGLFPRIIGKGDYAQRLCELFINTREELHSSPPPTQTSNLHPHWRFFDGIPSEQVDALIIIDRQVDFLSTLLTQLTYDGLLSEYFDTKANFVNVPSSIVDTPSSSSNAGGTSSATPSTLTAESVSSSTKTVLLDPADATFCKIRDVNFAAVPQILNRAARTLQLVYDNRPTQSPTSHTNTHDQARVCTPTSTSQLRDFVLKLPKLQAEQTSLRLHTNLAELLNEYTQSHIFLRILEIQQSMADMNDYLSVHHTAIENLIARAVPLPTVLRLLCIESIIGQGLKTRDFDSFRQIILQVYGYHHLLTLLRMERMGLLYAKGARSNVNSQVFSNKSQPVTPIKEPTSTSIKHKSLNTVGGCPTTNYAQVRRTLQLYKHEVQETLPDDISYVFSGPAPLSVRLVQCVLDKEFFQPKASSAVRTASQIIPESAKRLLPSIDLTLPSVVTGKSDQSGGSTFFGFRSVENSNASTVNQTGTNLGWQPFEDVLKHVAGCSFNYEQHGEKRLTEAKQLLDQREAGCESSHGMHESSKIRQKYIIICFVGGVTHAEIAALRFLKDKLNERYEQSLTDPSLPMTYHYNILICTTSILNGNRVIKAAFDPE